MIPLEILFNNKYDANVKVTMMYCLLTKKEEVSVRDLMKDLNMPSNDASYVIVRLKQLNLGSAKAGKFKFKIPLTLPEEPKPVKQTKAAKSETTEAAESSITVPPSGTNKK